MKIYEVMNDPDMTLRSQSFSCGLFYTKDRAKAYIKNNRLNNWEYWAIKEREVS